MSSVDCIIAKMEEWLDCEEGGSVHAHIINQYNQGRSASEYFMTINDPWCAAAVGAAFHECDMDGAIPISASCPRMVSEFKRWGRWRGPTYVPARGDIIFYDWDGDYAQDHVGVVTGYDSENSIVHVIEGNCNDTVTTRAILHDSRYINGYGCPIYEVIACDECVVQFDYTEYYAQINPGVKRFVDTLSTLKIGDSNGNVGLLQMLLCVSGKPVEVDGDFGSETLEAVLDWQTERGIERDGVVGKQTWSAFISYLDINY